MLVLRTYSEFLSRHIPSFVTTSAWFRWFSGRLRTSPCFSNVLRSAPDVLIIRMHIQIPFSVVSWIVRASPDAADCVWCFRILISIFPDLLFQHPSFLAFTIRLSVSRLGPWVASGLRIPIRFLRAFQRSYQTPDFDFRHRL